MEFTREELWALQSRAEKGHESVLNENWKRAYADLVHAISTLDAFIARSSTGIPKFTVTTESPVSTTAQGQTMRYEMQGGTPPPVPNPTPTPDPSPTPTPSPTPNQS